MRIVSKWVLPSLRLLVFAAIAVALAKLAFFSGATSGAPEIAVPHGSLVQPVVKVATKTVTNKVVIDATVEADAASPVKATSAGSIGKLLLHSGQTVAAGDTVATIVSETPRDPLIGADGVEVPRKPLVTVESITAPIAGTVSGLSVIPGQVVSVGDAVAAIAPSTFHLSGTLSTSQQYRLVSRPTEGRVEIKGGPAPFTCTGLTIAAGGAAPAAAGSTDSTESSGADGSGGATVRCAVPADVAVFAALTGKMTVPAGVAKDAATIPMTAVEGAAGKGVVYLAGSDGKVTGTRDVLLGINDGTTTEIVQGLKPGETVLEFVPGADAEQAGCNSTSGFVEVPPPTGSCN